MFHTKICGVRKLSDIKSVAACCADAIGLNFFARSLRFVDPETDDVLRLSQAAERAGLLRVGVFVNSDVETIVQIATRVGLDVIQLHGDESIDTVGQIQSHIELPLIRALAESLNLATVHLGMDIGLDLIQQRFSNLSGHAVRNRYPSFLLGAESLSPLKMLEAAL